MDSAVLFQPLGSGWSPFFLKHEVVFSLKSPGELARLGYGSPGLGLVEVSPPGQPTILRFRFQGAHPDTQVIGEGLLPGIVNYFKGSDPAKWRAHLPTYEGIAYEELYPGITLRYSAGAGRLKGTYTVSPGGKPSDIRWCYEGAMDVRLDRASGQLMVRLAEGDEAAVIIERKPLAWQEVAGERVPVDVGYTIQEDGSLGFSLGEYDATLALMIDPTLDYSTYVGGAGAEGSYGIAVDSSGYTYITGRSRTILFPSRVFTTTWADHDIFVTKLNPAVTGTQQMSYTTLLGGADDESTHGIKVDSSGKVYVVGYSESTGFPTTTNALQRVNRGYRNGVVVQLDADGHLLYSSYVGGSEFDEFVQLALGPGLQAGEAGAANAVQPRVYAVGFTYSADLVTTTNAYQGFRRGSVDASGNMFACGATRSITDFVTTTVSPAYGGGDFDAWLAKVSGSDYSLAFSRYVGGSGNDGLRDIAVDGFGIAYATGGTGSSNFPTLNPITSTFGGGTSPGYAQLGPGDAVVVAVDPNGRIVYGTYLGASGDEAGLGIALDGSRNIYVTGATSSTGFRTVNPFQGTHGGGTYDVFVAIIRGATEFKVFAPFTARGL